MHHHFVGRRAFGAPRPTRDEERSAAQPWCARPLFRLEANRVWSGFRAACRTRDVLLPRASTLGQRAEPSLSRKTHLDPPQNSPLEASITLYFATASV
jgi:hypothetical protein